MFPACSQMDALDPNLPVWVFPHRWPHLRDTPAALRPAGVSLDWRPLSNVGKQGQAIRVHAAFQPPVVLLDAAYHPSPPKCISRSFRLVSD